MKYGKYCYILFATLTLSACHSVAKKTVVTTETNPTASGITVVPVAATAVVTTDQEPPMPAALNGNPAGIEIETESYLKTSDSNSITWYGFQEGLDKAIKDKKILLVDSYTDWCYWCKVMDKETYTKKEIIKYMNDHFVAVKFNMENDGSFNVLGKKMTNVELYYWLANNNQTGFPTTMFWVNPGTDEYRPFYSGYYKADEFLKVLVGVKKQKK